MKRDHLEDLDEEGRIHRDYLTLCHKSFGHLAGGTHITHIIHVKLYNSHQLARLMPTCMTCINLHDEHLNLWHSKLANSLYKL